MARRVGKGTEGGGKKKSGLAGETSARLLGGRDAPLSP